MNVISPRAPHPLVSRGLSSVPLFPHQRQTPLPFSRTSIMAVLMQFPVAAE